MNIRVTQAADGFARRAFTIAEIEQMIAAGIIDRDESFELIEGEIVPRAAKNHVHERVKSTLGIALTRALPEGSWLNELWVVEANSRTTLVHTGPTALGWANVTEVPASGLLRPSAPHLFDFAVRLGELD